MKQHLVSLCSACLLLASNGVWGAEDFLQETAAVPDTELLEFLGTIAGLESMGVDIDYLLGDVENRAVSAPLEDEGNGHE